MQCEVQIVCELFSAVCVLSSVMTQLLRKLNLAVRCVSAPVADGSQIHGTPEKHSWNASVVLSWNTSETLMEHKCCTLMEH